MLFNRARALDYMRQCDLDALVATSSVNITYFSDYFLWLGPLFKEYMSSPGAPATLQQTYALFPAQGDPALVTTPLTAINAADSWVRDLRVYGERGTDTSLPPADVAPELARFADLLAAAPADATPTAALVRALRERGLATARIGVELEGLPAPACAALRAALPAAQIRDCSNLIRLIRMVKGPEELARLRRAAEIGEMATGEALALAHPGVTAGDLVQRFRAGVAARGADLDHFAYAMRGLGMVTEPAYTLAAGDVIFLDYGCIYRRYYSDAGTTLALGQPPAPLRQRHAALRACVEAGAAAMRPGVLSSTVQAAMWREFTGRGFSGCYPHGHGLGLEVRDYPVLVPDNGLRIRDECIDVPSDVPLETDMVLSLEAGMFVPGVGSLQVERNFVVTPGGSQPLTAQEREIVCA